MRAVLELLTDLGLVAVVEAVALVTEPDAYRHRQAESVRRIETRADVIGAPGTHGVRARRRQLLERAIPAGAADEVRLPATQQLPALLGLAEFDRDGVRVRPRERPRTRSTRRAQCRSDDNSVSACSAIMLIMSS